MRRLAALPSRAASLRAHLFRPARAALLVAALSSAAFAADCGCDAPGALGTCAAPPPAFSAALPAPPAAPPAPARMAPKDAPSPVQFKDAIITDARTGERKKLGDLWSDRPAVIAFLRRLG
jgi:hypothetical protein